MCTGPLASCYVRALGAGPIDPAVDHFEGASHARFWHIINGKGWRGDGHHSECKYDFFHWGTLSFFVGEGAIGGIR
jgi:hypothetical protein